MEGTPIVRPRHAALVALLLGLLPVYFHFLARGPVGWDGAEYCWAVRHRFLPHNPYVAYYLLGRLGELTFEAPLALSLLSLCSAMAAILLLHVAVQRILLSANPLPPARPLPAKPLSGPERLIPLVAAGLLGTHPLFVRQGTTQEIYAVAAALALLALVLALDGRTLQALAAGLITGFALATHNAVIFLLPALGAAVFVARGARRHVRFGFWLVGTAVSSLAFLLLLWVLLPPGGPGSLGRYLAGITPGPALARIALVRIVDPQNLAGGAAHLLERLRSAPVGLDLLHLSLGALGLLLASRYSRSAALLWTLWAAPYLGFEVVLDHNLDRGLYVLFLLPPLTALMAVGLGHTLGNRDYRLPSVVAAAFSAVCLAFLLAPQVQVLVRQRDEPGRMARLHRALTALGESLEPLLPADAVLVQPRGVTNVNLLPYYTGRTPIIRQGGVLLLFEDRGAHTPLNLNSFVPLSNARLRALLAQRTPVYALEGDALRASGPRDLNAGDVVWVREHPLELPSGWAADVAKAYQAVEHPSLYRARERRVAGD
jgi:hypothetical protein